MTRQGTPKGGSTKSCSPKQRALLAGFYYRQDYFHNIGEIYSVSSLMVCRSGAGSLNEISRVGKPALLVPKVNLPGDHQVMNARAMKSVGAAEVLFEDTVMENGVLLEKLDGQVLAEKMLALLKDPVRLKQMGRRTGLSQAKGHRTDNERNLWGQSLR